MNSSIHISRRSIKVLNYARAGGKISVKGYYTYPLPDECVINGVILDAHPVIEGLMSLKNSYPAAFKKVSLVLDGSFVYTKRISVPARLNAVMYDNVIRDEFTEVTADSANLLCSYFPLANNTDGSKQVLACGVENAHVQTYLTIFSQAGITLSTIHLGVQSLLHFISSRSELGKMPFVLSVVDDMILLSMIFQDGVSVFQSRTRLYGDDRRTLVSSTLDSLSGIMQFNKSQNFADISHSLYIGLDDSDMTYIKGSNQYTGVSFQALDIYRDAAGRETRSLPPDAHFVFLNAMLPDNVPDLYASMRTLERAKKFNKPKNVFIPIVLITAGVLIAALAVVFVLVSLAERNVQIYNDYLQDPNTVAIKTEIDLLKANTAHINDLAAAVTQRNAELDATPQVSRELLETIVRTGGNTVVVTAMSFNETNRAINISATGISGYFAAQFVEKLKADPLIYSVVYTAYSTNADGEQLFSIDVIQEGWQEPEPEE